MFPQKHAPVHVHKVVCNAIKVLTSTKELEMLGSFIAGISFTLFFTAAPAVVTLGEIALSQKARSHLTIRAGQGVRDVLPLMDPLIR